MPPRQFLHCRFGMSGFATLLQSMGSILRGFMDPHSSHIAHDPSLHHLSTILPRSVRIGAGRPASFSAMSSGSGHVRPFRVKNFCLTFARSAFILRVYFLVLPGLSARVRFLFNSSWVHVFGTAFCCAAFSCSMTLCSCGTRRSARS